MTRFMRKLHKWIGLLVGLQFLVWLLSGLGMNLLDHEVVSGDDMVAFEHDVQAVDPSPGFVEPQRILDTLAGRQVNALELKRQVGYWVWRAQTDAGVVLFNARTGARMEIDEATVRRVAQGGYFGDGAIRSATLLQEPTLEARGHALPIWRIDFDDERRTRYYVGADEGRILERRNDLWQLFDVFWMLHTMDYVGRDDFNTPWMILVAFLALWLAISGVVLLVNSFSRRRPPASMS
jgi:Na+-transporting NADH:ubiquinone oxidoreductase subunit F